MYSVLFTIIELHPKCQGLARIVLIYFVMSVVHLSPKLSNVTPQAKQKRSTSCTLDVLSGTEINNTWAPHIICTASSNGLKDWLNKRKKAMPSAVPMI